MRELNPGMLKELGLTAKKISREFGAYLCETDKGLYLVKDTDASERELRFAHLIKEHLRAEGMEETDHYVLAEEGKPWIRLNRETITIRRWLRGEEADLEQAEGQRCLGEALARFHLHCKGLELPEEFNVFPHYNDWPGRMERQMRRIRGMGKTIRRRGRLEEFDLLFLKMLRTYEEDGKKALAGMENGCMEKVSRKAWEERAFAYGAFSNHCVLFSGKDMLFHDFEGAQLAPPLMDLARLLEKTLRKNEWKAACGEEVLNAYEAVKELKKEEKQALYYYLLYPSRAWDLAGEGYERRSQWIPGAYRSKLEQFMEKVEERRDCLQILQKRLEE